MLTYPGPATVQAGWKLWDNAEMGVSIVAPQNWMDKFPTSIDPITGQPVDISNLPPDMQKMLGEIPEQMKKQEEEEAAEQAKQDADSGTVLRLYDIQSRPIPGEVPTSIVVNMRNGSGTLKGDVAAYERNFGKDVKSSKQVQLPVGPAQEFVIESTDVKGDVVHRVAYVLSHKGKTIHIVFRQTSNAGAIGPVALPVAETFRIMVK
jgi:hypothetical protein